MARKDDVESQRGRRDRQADELEDTEYKPINWKRFFFAPKYIRTSPRGVVGGRSRP